MKGIDLIFQHVRNKKKNRENTHQRKTITRTRQYLRGSVICLRPRNYKDFTIIKEEYRVQLAATIFSLSHRKTRQQHHHKTLITKVSSTMGKRTKSQ